MRQKHNIYFLAGLAALAGLMSACSSSDDNIEPTPAQKQVTVGALMDDLTAQYQNTITNCLNTATGAKTRAAGYDQSTLGSYGIPLDMPGVPTVPDCEEYSYGSDGVRKISKDGDVYLGCVGKWVSPTETRPLTDVYITAKNVTLTGANGGPTNLYIMPGSTVTFQKGFLENASITVYNYGTIKTTNKNGWEIFGNEKLYNQGTIETKGKNFLVQGVFYTTGDLAGATGYNFQNGCHVNILGNLDMSGQDLIQTGNNDPNKVVEGYIHVGGKITARNLTLGNVGNLFSDCGVDVAEKFVTNAGNNLYANYIHAGSMKQCAGAKLFLGDGAYVNVDGGYENLNNGNDAGVTLISGEGTHAVFKAASIKYNSSGETGQALGFQTPKGGTIGIDCNLFSYNDHEALPHDSVDLAGGGTVQWVDPSDAQDLANFYIPKGTCNPQYGEDPKTDPDPTPDPTPDPEPDPQPVVVAVQHTHDISATCVQTDGNGNVYLSFHQRGNKQSGCIERLVTTGDKTELKQFVRDHNESIDFNHIALTNGAAGRRLYAVGNNKNGGFLGYMNVKSNGDLDVQSQDMNGLDSVDIARKSYAPLQLVKLQEAQANAAQGRVATRANSGDGNAVVYNNGILKVASTYGYETFDENLQGITVKHTPGKGKHIAVTPSGDIISSYFTEQVTSSVDPLKAVPLKIEKYAASDNTMENPTLSFDANTVTPNNGKNVICEYGGLIYSCQGSNGLFVYDASTGEQKYNYVLNNVGSKNENLQLACNGVAVDNDYIYVAYGSRGLRVLNRSDYKEVAKFVCGRSANYVTLANGYIYVAYGRNGLKVFKLVTPAK